MILYISVPSGREEQLCPNQSINQLVSVNCLFTLFVMHCRATDPKYSPFDFHLGSLAHGIKRLVATQVLPSIFILQGILYSFTVSNSEGLAATRAAIFGLPNLTGT